MFKYILSNVLEFGRPKLTYTLQDTDFIYNSPWSEESFIEVYGNGDASSYDTIADELNKINIIIEQYSERDLDIIFPLSLYLLSGINSQRYYPYTSLDTYLDMCCKNFPSFKDEYFEKVSATIKSIIKNKVLL